MWLQELLTPNSPSSPPYLVTATLISCFRLFLSLPFPPRHRSAHNAAMCKVLCHLHHDPFTQGIDSREAGAFSSPTTMSAPCLLSTLKPKTHPVAMPGLLYSSEQLVKTVLKSRLCWNHMLFCPSLTSALLWSHSRGWCTLRHCICLSKKIFDTLLV